jgi:hypothetical protein
MKQYLSGKDYAPTMVANGSKRHPLRSHYSRLHSNPEDIEVDLDDIGDAAPAKTASVKVAGKKGRKKMSDSAKARAKAERSAGKTPRAASEKKVSEAAEIRKQISEMLGKLVKSAKTPKEKQSESAKAAKEAKKAKQAQVVADLKDKIKALRETKGLTLPKRFPALKVQPDLQQLMELLKEKKANKAPASAGGAGRKKMSDSAKARAKAERDARSPSTVAALKAARAAGKGLKKNPGNKPSPTSIGPYKITLLKNPITDFEIGGVKVLPAVAGAAGAVALIQMKEGYLKRVLPGAVTVALGAAGLYFADKNKSAGMLKDLSKDIAAFGMFAAVNGAVGVTINESVNKLMAPSTPSPAPTPKLNGGAHFSELNGGGWAGQEVPQLNGYHMSGANSGYPEPFSMNGETGYFVPSQLALNGLNGYHMSGDANSAATAAAISALNGGRFAEPIGGHDLNGYQD